MNLIFDWSEDFYEEKKEWRSDAKVLSLEISQRECCFALAKITLFCDDQVFPKKYAKIGAQYFEKRNNENLISRVELIFSGRLVSFPLALGKSCVQLEFISEPSDYQRQLDAFLQHNISAYQQVDKHQISANSANFDELFFSENDLQNPTVFLEGSSKCFYWDMKGGKLSLSEINRGQKNFEIDGAKVLEKSLKISLAREPYKNVSINLSANWTRRTSGLVDLYPFVAKKFSEGIVCSFTNIKSKIKRLCSLHSDDYDALSCSVRETDPSTIVPFQTFAKTSRKFEVQQDKKDKNEAGEGKNSKKITAQFKKFYFYGEMLFCWHRKQKISESIRLDVVNSKINRGREKRIFMRLNSIQLPKEYPYWNFFTQYYSGDKVIFEGSVFECSVPHLSTNFFDEKNWKKIVKVPDALPSDSCGSFFKTERGKNAIKYALQNAIALMNYSARYIEISFAVDATEFLGVTINDQITLFDARLDGGKISGKVTKTRFVATSKKRILHITIGCCLQNFLENSTEQINKYLKKLWSENNDSNNDNDRFSMGDIVRDVEVINPPEEQEKILGESNAKSVTELESRLKNHPTKIKIFLAPLKGSVAKNVELPQFFLR